MVVDKGTRTGLPSTSELYTDKSSGTHAIQSSAGDLKLLSPPGNARTWDEPIVQPQRKKHWYDRFVETPTRMAATAITTAAVIAAVATSPAWAPAVASKFEARTSIPPITYNPPAQTQPIDANALYRSNAQAAILQSVPELANYKSALDYTTQRLTDMKNVYNIGLEQAIVPVSKWVKANIDWDKKSERLVPFSEEIDFMPDTLFGSISFDPETNNTPKSTKMDAFEQNTSVMIDEHSNIWKEVNDTAKMDQYFTWLREVPIGHYEGVEMSFPPYVKAIQEKGTISDKQHWALYMKGIRQAGWLGSEERRKEAGLTYILAVGGKAQIEYWGFQGLDGGSGVGHGDLAVFLSPQLKQYLESDLSTFGHLLDPDYLSILPSGEGAQFQGTSGRWPKVAAMWREQPVNGRTQARVYIYGDEATARKYGHN